MKRIISVFMVLCLILAIAPVAFATGDETFDTWDGTSSTTPELVGGVYQIDSAADLVGFAALVNSGNHSNIDAVLLTGIDLGGNSFTPIGAYAYKENDNVVNSGYAYIGEFNGNGHVIKNGFINNDSGIYNLGIFGFVNVGGNVHDLTVSCLTVTGTSPDNEASTGAVIGILREATAINLAANSCTVTGVHRVGGVIGSVRDTSVVNNCDNIETNVTATGMYCGGVIGAAHDLNVKLSGFTPVADDPADVKYCDNSGDVNGTTEVGGIIGYTDQTMVSNCTNSGGINAAGNYGCGGIIGFDAYNTARVVLVFVYEPETGATVTSCTNSGTISGGRAAGIVGTLGATPGDDQPDEQKTLTKITNCTNTGAITGTEGKCGSIFGYQITYAHGDADEYINNMYVKITNCTVSGTVNSQAPTEPTPSNYWIA